MTTTDPGGRAAAHAPGPVLVNAAEPGHERMLMTAELDQLRLQVDIGSEVTVIRLDGELDPHTAPLLQREFDRVVDLGATRVVFDLRDLRFIDSSGLRVVISAHRRLTTSGGSFALASPNDTTRRLLEITGLLDHFEIVEAP